MIFNVGAITSDADAPSAIVADKSCIDETESVADALSASEPDLTCSLVVASEALAPSLITACVTLSAKVFPVALNFQ